VVHAVAGDGADHHDADGATPRRHQRLVLGRVAGVARDQLLLVQPVAQPLLGGGRVDPQQPQQEVARQPAPCTRNALPGGANENRLPRFRLTLAIPGSAPTWVRPAIEPLFSGNAQYIK
jgi:hypothetical protein